MSRTNGNNGAPFQMVSFPKGVMWHSSINMKKVTVYLSRMKKALKEKEVNLKEKKKTCFTFTYLHKVSVVVRLSVSGSNKNCLKVKPSNTRNNA